MSDETPPPDPSPTSPPEPTAPPDLTDLFYPSESDEPVEWVTCPLDQAEPLTATQVKAWLMVPPSVYVEEKSEADFWALVTTPEDWYGEEETERLNRFQQIQQWMEQHLTTRQLFRVGDTEVDVYLLGRQPNGERAGLKTMVVET